MTIEMLEMYKAKNHELRELLRLEQEFRKELSRLEQEVYIEEHKKAQRLEESIKILVDRYNYSIDTVDNKIEVNVYTSVISSLQDILDGVPV